MREKLCTGDILPFIYMYEHCLAVLEISCTNCWHLESQNKYLEQFISLLAACVLKGSFLKID